MEKMISSEIEKQLIEVFGGLKDPVSILFFGSKMQACEYCEHTWELLSEISALSEKIDLQTIDIDEDKEAAQKYRIELVPGIVIAAKSDEEIRDYGVRFSGIPAGHEFSSLINSIVLVSGRESGLSEEGKTYLKSLDTPVHLQVFVTTSCGYCPQAVTLAHQMAIESDFVHAEMVEAVEFSELSNRYGVSGVPHTVINEGKGEIIGAVPERMLIDEVRQAVAAA
jgi:glutaredoxin-like protein